MRARSQGQRGGVAILIALGFLVFSIPLITGSLGLAQTTSIDARVKTNAMHQEYCALAVTEYIKYLISDFDRWSDFLGELGEGEFNEDNENKINGDVDICGEINLKVERKSIDLSIDEEGDLKTRFNPGLADLETVFEPEDIETLRRMVEEHLMYTNSNSARRILDQWVESLPRFKKVMPRDYVRVLLERQNQEEKERGLAASVQGQALILSTDEE